MVEIAVDYAPGDGKPQIVDADYSELDPMFVMGMAMSGDAAAGQWLDDHPEVIDGVADAADDGEGEEPTVASSISSPD